MNTIIKPRGYRLINWDMAQTVPKGEICGRLMIAKISRDLLSKINKLREKELILTARKQYWPIIIEQFDCDVAVFEDRSGEQMHSARFDAIYGDLKMICPGNDNIFTASKFSKLYPGKFIIILESFGFSLNSE